ncbi:MAG: phage major capsid protein [Patescibacteria group bacterium]|nr:phage major capsid protein [Patescibacteria group bacterium]MDE2227325.1 phage major capsid protein [Patescibacteria group bacterium]
MFDNVVDTLTLEDIVPVVVDTILRTNRFITTALMRTKRFKAATQDFPIKFQVGTPITSFIGMQALPTAFTDTRVLMKYIPAFTQGNIALAGTDMMANNVDQQVLDLVEVESVSRAQDLADALGTMAYNIGVSTNINSLPQLIDDGTNSATIGGLSRSTYTTLKSTVISSNTLSLYGLRTLYNDIVDAGVVPTRTYTDFGTWQLYESLLQPQEVIYKQVNIVPNFQGYTGFDGLMFAGLEMVPDRKCPSGFLYMLNEDHLSFYGLDGKIPSFPLAERIQVASKLFTGNQYNEVGNLGFWWTGFIHTTQQFAFNSFLILAGNLITDNPRRHGVQSVITQV